MEHIINTFYNPSYPCKTISLFVKFYYNSNYYDRIKLITQRKINPTNDKDKEYQEYFLLFSLFFSTYIKSEFIQYKKFYKMVYGKDISKKVESLIPVKYYTELELFTWMKKVIKIVKTLKSSEAFFLYLLICILVNNNYNKSCVLPDFTILKKFNPDLTEYFLFSYFNQKYMETKKNLKDDFIFYIKNNKDKICKFGIEKMFLFGSVLQNTYHDYSDFDLAVEYNTKNINQTDNLLYNFIKEKFDRKSDIHDIKYFKEMGISVNMKQII